MVVGGVPLKNPLYMEGGIKYNYFLLLQLHMYFI